MHTLRPLNPTVSQHLPSLLELRGRSLFLRLPRQGVEVWSEWGQRTGVYLDVSERGWFRLGLWRIEFVFSRVRNDGRPRAW